MISRFSSRNVRGENTEGAENFQVFFAPSVNYDLLPSRCGAEEKAVYAAINKPTATRTGVTRLMITFKPIDGASFSMFSAFW